MGTFTYFAAIVAMFLVAVVLIRGLFNMMKGGSAMTSNKLMQLRILLQAIALGLIMLTLWLTGGGRPPQKESRMDLHHAVILAQVEPALVKSTDRL